VTHRTDSMVRTVHSEHLSLPPNKWTSYVMEGTMGWRNVAAGLGTGATVQALKAIEGQVSKGKYKRLIATAVAELLALHPDIGKAKARRRARRITGAKPSRKLMRARKNLGLKDAAEGLVAAAATAGIAKAAGLVGNKLQQRFGGRDDRNRDDERAVPSSVDGGAPEKDAEKDATVEQEATL
jgi:hypothetical protein